MNSDIKLARELLAAEPGGIVGFDDQYGLQVAQAAVDALKGKLVIVPRDIAERAQAVLDALNG